MVEWSITPVLKTGVLRGTGGSNPSLSAKQCESVEINLNRFFCVEWPGELALQWLLGAKKDIALATIRIVLLGTPRERRDARSESLIL